jgi:hypothetical protein
LEISILSTTFNFTVAILELVCSGNVPEIANAKKRLVSAPAYSYTKPANRRQSQKQNGMYHIVYQSTAVKELSTQDLLDILHKARRNNAALGVTGLLLYSGGRILQVLEGEETTLRRLYKKIQADYRHTRVFTLSDGPISTRVFGDWCMAFQSVNKDDFEYLAGYINPKRVDFLDEYWPRIDPDLLEMLREFMLSEQPGM